MVRAARVTLVLSGWGARRAIAVRHPLSFRCLQRTFSAVWSIARISSVEKSSMCRKWCPFLGGLMFFPLYMAFACVTTQRLDRETAARNDEVIGTL